MKKTYVITGSVGHISKPIVEGLVKAGNDVRVITSSSERVADIEKSGAKALVGHVQDRAFLTKAFAGADAVYTMVPPIWQTTNWRASQNEIGDSYVEAIEANNIRYVVNLSSIGAHVGNGIGPVDGVADLEKRLNNVSGLNVKHLRPAFFYYNFFAQIPLIKQASILGANYGDKEKLFLVHTNDIAAAALEELLSLDFNGNIVRYVISDERSAKEIADVLGDAINKDLSWVVLTDEQQKQGLLEAGLSETHAEGYTQMGKALREGIMQEDARRTRPAFAKTKLEDFAKEFAAVFSGS